MKNIMIDLETMGRRPDGAIVSIGAVPFTDTGVVGEPFYEIVSIKSSVAAGMSIEPDTILWWLKQNEMARDEICKPGIELDEALMKFTAWWESQPGAKYIWANSPSFDCVILSSAYSLCGRIQPWRWAKEMDCRTLSNKYQAIKKKHVDAEPVTHHAVEDCLLQIKYVTEILNTMK